MNSFMLFNPNSVIKPKQPKRDSRKRVQFAPRLVQNEWPRPTSADEYLFFHSRDDEDHARDKINTCHDFRQYKKEEWQSFRDRAYAQLIYRLAQQTKRSPIPATTNPKAQRVKHRPTSRLIPQRVENAPLQSKSRKQGKRSLTSHELRRLLIHQRLLRV